jgi:hypothetical protein
MPAPVTVYLAGRSEDLTVIRTLRTRLGDVGIACSSRWLEEGGIVANQRVGAVQCLMDIARAQAVVLFNIAKIHRTGTGGRHVETGIAIATGKPVVVYGDRENVFHYLPTVRCVPRGATLSDLVAEIQLAVLSRGQEGSSNG